MAFFLRQGVVAVVLGILLFCISCEKHPVGQLPEVQREQPDPAKEWSEAPKKDSHESSSHPQSGEAPHDAR
jgi:hypothetical protein